MQCKINIYIKLYLFLSQQSVFYKASPFTISQTRGNTACLSTGRGLVWGWMFVPPDFKKNSVYIIKPLIFTKHGSKI